MNKNLIQLQKSLKKSEEWKFVDLPLNGVTVPAAGSTFVAANFISGTAQGIDVNNRIGRKILIKSLFMRISVYLPGGALSDNSNIIRIMIIQDILSNGRDPATTGINGILQEANVLSNYNTRNTKRYRYLMDKSFPLSFGGPATTVIKKNIILNLVATYDNTTAVFPSQQSNSLWIFYISDSTLGGPSLSARLRLRFVDM